MITGDIALIMLFGFLIGFLAGFVLASMSQKETVIGNFHIDRSADEPYVFLEIEKKGDFERIAKMDHITLKVIDEDYPKATSK